MVNTSSWLGHEVNPTMKGRHCGSDPQSPVGLSLPS